MKTLGENVPEKDLEQKRLDTLNSFVFNVDTPAELAEVYSRYYLRNEPLDTLARIQDAFLTASREELVDLAQKLLDPKKIQIVVVADKATLVNKEGAMLTLEEDLKALAQKTGLPFREIELR